MKTNYRITLQSVHPLSLLQAPVPSHAVRGIENTVFKCKTMELEPHTRMLFYTDGVTESQNRNQELYGEERLRELANRLQKTAGNTVETTDAIFKAVEDFADGEPQSDDITLLLLQYNGKK